MEFYLVTTDHFTDRIWFKDDQDFRVAMNIIAVLSFKTGIPILAFILMSNHVHFVLQCSINEAKMFIDELKTRYGQYLNIRYGTKEFLRRNKVDYQRLLIEDESLHKGLAYTVMNCVAANICLNAMEYPWGSGGVYFRAAPPRGRMIGELSPRAQMILIHSKTMLPKDMILGEDGYILPDSFVAVKFVEDLFGSPKRMNYFLVNSSKAKRRIEARKNGLPSFKDQVIYAAIPDLCRSIFLKRFEDLTRDEKVELTLQIKRRFSADVAQIARVIGMPYSEVASMVDSF